MQRFWRIPRMWKGKRVFIFGGGPSLPALVHGKDFSRFPVIGVNDAFRLGGVDLLWFGDSRWYWWNKADVDAFKGLKVSGNRNPSVLGSVEGQSGIRIVRLSNARGLTRLPGTVNFNSSSGAAAVNLALHLGAKEIVLVGFDMRMVPDLHGVLRKNWREHPGPEFGGSAIEMDYKNFIHKFSYIAKDAKMFELKIFNATPESAMTFFPMVKLEQMLC